MMLLTSLLSLLLVYQACATISPPFSPYMRLLSDQNRNQCPMHRTPFPCTFINRTAPEADNVNELQPGDISIVAALGDSVIGSTGALAPNFFKTREQYRGVSFAIGQTGNWQTVTTLPNILKQFNPRIVGGSTNVGGENDPGSNLNLASPGANSVNLIQQAARLIEILSNPTDDKRWKVVTILIGHNDICTHPCNTTYTSFDASPPMYRERVASALDMLRDNLPRTFVNMVPLIDVTVTLGMTDKHPFCYISHPYVCPCLYGAGKAIWGGGTPLGREGMRRLQMGYVWELHNLVDTGRYERKDFTVVIQPAFTDLELFMRPDKRGKRQVVDYSFFAPDCLHPSQKLHGLMARALWNNMLSPEGEKATSWSRSPPFLCPSPESPYLATRLNSKKMDMASMERDYGSYMREVNAHRLACYM